MDVIQGYSYAVIMQLFKQRQTFYDSNIPKFTRFIFNIYHSLFLFS